jgi:transcriptional regulator with PAS, ATPase and Fis domain
LALPTTVTDEVAMGLADPAQPRTLGEVERRAILAALERHHGNRTQAATELQISVQTLWGKLKADEAESRPS